MDDCFRLSAADPACSKRGTPLRRTRILFSRIFRRVAYSSRSVAGTAASFNASSPPGSPYVTGGRKRKRRDLIKFRRSFGVIDRRAVPGGHGHVCPA